MKKANTYLSVLCILTASLSCLSLDAYRTEPRSHYQEEILHTEAGKIDFRSIHCINTSEAGYKLSKFSEENNLLELANGSVWIVPKTDIIKGWDKSHTIVITQNHAPFSSYLYKYALVNVQLKLATPASLVHEPVPGKESLYVSDLDNGNHIVTLNTGRKWIVHSSDQSSFDRLNLNDRVMIGVNTKDDEERSPYLLIDTADKGRYSVRILPITN